MLLTAVFRGGDRNYFICDQPTSLSSFLKCLQDLQEGVTLLPESALALRYFQTDGDTMPPELIQTGVHDETLVIAITPGVRGLYHGNVVETASELEAELADVEKHRVAIGPFRDWIGESEATLLQHRVLRVWVEPEDIN